jgi:hypothetical protein
MRHPCPAPLPNNLTGADATHDRKTICGISETFDPVTKAEQQLIGAVISVGAPNPLSTDRYSNFLASRLVRNRICQRMGRGVQ